ncbi:hypothetical protein [Clostridioides sp. ZZV14-6345]|nr:hypothetical protein [Clostridioides sp. ZZV14-6345]
MNNNEYITLSIFDKPNAKLEFLILIKNKDFTNKSEGMLFNSNIRGR